MIIDDPDVTEPYPVYIRVGREISENIQLEIPRADVVNVARQFAWLSFSYSEEPIPFGRNQITWYGVNETGKYYMSETFQYDSEWAEDDVWVAPIEVGSGQDEHVGLERNNPENGWYLFKDYLADPQKIAPDHIGSILLRMIWSIIYPSGERLGKLEIR